MQKFQIYRSQKNKDTIVKKKDMNKVCTVFQNFIDLIILNLPSVN